MTSHGRCYGIKGVYRFYLILLYKVKWTLLLSIGLLSNIELYAAYIVAVSLERGENGSEVPLTLSNISLHLVVNH